MKKADFSKKILNTLSGKQALKVDDLKAEIGGKLPKKPLKTEVYAINRSIKNLADTGLIERLEGGQSEYARLTAKGRIKASSQKLDTSSSLVNPAWDGKWRLILIDLPEDRKAEREALRYLLKKAGFIMLKNSVWASPYPFEFMFENIKKDFGLTSELMIVVTNQVDIETEKILFESFGK